MSEKKKILIFVDWFLPGYKAGGPIRSVANIVEHLSGFFDFFIVTSDRDFGCKKPYENIKTNVFVKKSSYSIIYLSPEYQNKKQILKIIKELNFDTVYFNSLFSVKFTLLPLRILKKHKRNSKIILAPRGMLGKGALSLKKNKKQLFLFIAKFLHLFDDILWHATDKTEVEDIKRYFGKKTNIKLVPNISGKIDNYKQREKEISKFIFLSRIAEKKNLLYAIKIFQNIETNKDVLFSVYGTNEDENYLKKCKSEAEKLKKNIKVEFKGEISHENVNKILREHHFYFLPTLHENFGHSIFEALSAGCPVIISDQTPWRNLEEKKIGWDIPLTDKQKFSEVIQKCIDMPQEEYDKMSQNAYNFAKEYSEKSEAIEQMKKMFEK